MNPTSTPAWLLSLSGREEVELAQLITRAQHMYAPDAGADYGLVQTVCAVYQPFVIPSAAPRAHPVLKCVKLRTRTPEGCLLGPSDELLLVYVAHFVPVATFDEFIMPLQLAITDPMAAIKQAVLFQTAATQRLDAGALIMLMRACEEERLGATVCFDASDKSFGVVYTPPDAASAAAVERYRRACAVHCALDGQVPTPDTTLLALTSALIEQLHTRTACATLLAEEKNRDLFGASTTMGSIFQATRPRLSVTQQQQIVELVERAQGGPGEWRRRVRDGILTAANLGERALRVLRSFMRV